VHGFGKYLLFGTSNTHCWALSVGTPVPLVGLWDRGRIPPRIGVFQANRVQQVLMKISNLIIPIKIGTVRAVQKVHQDTIKEKCYMWLCDDFKCRDV